MKEEIREHLRNGESISQVCTDYKITFTELCDLFEVHKQPSSVKPKTSPHYAGKYIMERNGHYYLRKTINGKHRLFGVYSSLDDAERVRNYCNRNGWKQRSIDSICKRLGVERITGNRNSHVRYS